MALNPNKVGQTLKIVIIDRKQGKGTIFVKLLKNLGTLCENFLSFCKSKSI